MLLLDSKKLKLGILWKTFSLSLNEDYSLIRVISQPEVFGAGGHRIWGERELCYLKRQSKTVL